MSLSACFVEKVIVTLEGFSESIFKDRLNCDSQTHKELNIFPPLTSIVFPFPPHSISTTIAGPVNHRLHRHDETRCRQKSNLQAFAFSSLARDFCILKHFHLIFFNNVHTFIQRTIFFSFPSPVSVCLVEAEPRNKRKKWQEKKYVNEIFT